MASCALVGEISILTIGPLTNVAQAILLDSEFPSRVRQFYSMGSRVTGAGADVDESKCKNATVKLQPDFNYGLDPLSNAVFFNNTRHSKIRILPGSSIWKAPISMVRLHV